jgi:adenine-specific DNA methylase
LADFFYVWLKRILKSEYQHLFQEKLPDKTDEVVQLARRFGGPYAHKNEQYFEKNMTKALSEARRYIRPDGIGSVVFAHKSTSGWEAQLKAMHDAGWIITASWPVDTECGSRMNAMGTATLASSVHIVMRPRENPDGSLRTDNIGDWRDVLAELPKRIHEWMPRLADEGVVGADAIFACLGPALEIYSRYSSVEKASGEKVTLGEYLEEVWAAVAREALNMIFEGADASGFEEDARLTAMWLWTLRTAANGGNGDESDEQHRRLPGYSLEYDAARKIAQGLGVHLENLSHLVEIRGNTAMLLSASSRAKYLFGKEDSSISKRSKKSSTKQLDFFSELGIETDSETGGQKSGLKRFAPGSTVLDQLHQSMILFGAGRSEALKRFLVEDGVGRNPLFWRLAQALSALYPSGSDEKRWVDGVLARKKGLGF